MSIANRIIEYIEGNYGTVGEMSQGEKDRILGTAYFMRGLQYFRLLHYWGKPFDESDKWGVVIHTEVVTEVEKGQKPRAKVSEVYKLIEDDFSKAKGLLWDFEQMATLKPTELGRPTKAAASAWLGKHIYFRGNMISQFPNFRILKRII
ncbi:MAG: RagB/SusD family nutrient uptake outer membrane protein [Bacteroidales bacterium]|nr:RagB/SusD family nutrient uptake outer membrane protein [Bacteroidales bacterium]